MEEINKRVRELREYLGKNQEQMGGLLKISKSGVCDIESGRRKVRENHIVLLKNNVPNLNEKWLRYGEGEMLKPQKPIDVLLAELSFGEDEFIKDFLEVYSSLDATCRNALKEIMHRMAEKHSGKDRGD